MEEFEIDGNTYIYENGIYFDENFITLCKNDLLKVMNVRLKQIDYYNISSHELLSLIKNCKENELYQITKDLAEIGINRHGDDNFFMRTVLPMYTSTCRKLHMPNEAIKTAKKFLIPSTASPALDTSLAAAYCDIGDYINAKKHADRAYAKLADLPYEMKIEISNVYKRIKAESKK